MAHGTLSCYCHGETEHYLHPIVWLSQYVRSENSSAWRVWVGKALLGCETASEELKFSPVVCALLATPFSFLMLCHLALLAFFLPATFFNSQLYPFLGVPPPLLPSSIISSLPPLSSTATPPLISLPPSLSSFLPYPFSLPPSCPLKPCSLEIVRVQ